MQIVVGLNVRRQVRGWFLTILISVHFSHISCTFANTGCKRSWIGYVDFTFKQSLCKRINQTEVFYRYVLFIEVRVKNGEHFSRRVMENTDIRTTVVMRGASNWHLSAKIVFSLKIYLPFLRLLRRTAVLISDPNVTTPPALPLSYFRFCANQQPRLYHHTVRTFAVFCDANGKSKSFRTICKFWYFVLK